MNFLKSLFISGYLTIATVIAGYGGWMLSQGADAFVWGGVLLTVVPILLIISRWMIFQNIARTPAHFPLLNGLAILGTFTTIGQSDDGDIAPLLAAVGMISLLIYIYWYSRLDRRTGSHIKVGDRLPDFTVTDVAGATVTAGQLTDRPAILIFYRGNWCPLCMAQVKEMVGLYEEIRNMGVRVAFISPQPHTKTIALAKRFSVAFDFLTDRDNQAARRLGIESPNGLPMGMQALGYESDTVLPTVIITDQKGRVIWTHETDNYRVRPDPDVYLDILRQQGLGVKE